MWQGQNTWIHYVKNIIAADLSSAVFLASYLRRANMNKSYIAHLEAIDLQRYKVIRKTNKVRAALNESANTPFIFFIGKN